ncbi:MAG: DUF3253 domain-containing protein [Planctomycetes bacterium]|nr:DUF3253 domain-containing protein [Planctomycetota bacterium]
MPLMLTPKIEAQLRAITLELLREKRGRASIGPADIARRFKPDGWKSWMDSVKEVAHRLAEEGAIEVTRHGKPTKVWPWRGVIRFRNPLAAGAEPALENDADESDDAE